MNESHDDPIDALLRRQFEGPVANDGFTERLMQHLPSRRRGTAWPLWGGVLTGAAACWICLDSVPLLHLGWRDWLAGDLSTSAIGMALLMVAISLLSCLWGLLENRGS
ncbi:hypothetical protein ISP15_14625 [Dyella jejuensis]|uniref:DUF5056 domain-containing protein n=1 Tax=Dyella jejuensis TaxID=1432009 RepID=A0ABW8JKR7_9GAMM